MNLFLARSNEVFAQVEIKEFRELQTDGTGGTQGFPVLGFIDRENSLLASCQP